MDPKQYRQTETRRGFTYNYYYRPADSAQPTILFLHGFPSTSADWSAQVTFFAAKGYGIIVPDTLGYGGTSAPTDAQSYGVGSMSEDILDILDAVHVDKVIAVAHDWGCGILSRFWNIHPERITAAAFLAAGYIPPSPDYNYERTVAQMKQLVGTELYGYWELFNDKEGPALCEKNIDSFYSLLFPKDPAIWKTDMCPTTKAKEWVAGNTQTPLPSYWDDAARKEHQKQLLKRGLSGPVNYYRAMIAQVSNEDDSKIPKEKYELTVPVFLGTALQDYVCLAAGAKALTSKFAKQLTVKDFDTSHWVMFEMPDELNNALEEFVKTL